jgi:hypothetical protein
VAAFLVELFATNVAYSGVSVGYQFGAVLGGGMFPLVASALLAAIDGAWWTVACHLVFGALITTIALRYLQRTRAAEAAALGEEQLTQRVEADATAPVLRHDLEETSRDY